MTAYDSNAFQAELLQILAPDQVLSQEPLAAHTTFQIGGPAEWLVLPRSEQEIADVFALCRATDVPVRVLGLGSNVLVPDEGMPGVTVKLAENFSDISVDGSVIRAQAGATNEALAQAALDAALTGYEFASGIPGSVGGAAIMNAGAYEGEFKDVATSVRCLTPEGEVIEVPADQANWGYRHSSMMDNGSVVLSATLELAPGDPAAIRERMDDLRERRTSKQPLEMPSAGSTFKRPEGYFAGKLIQDADLMGHTHGGAQVSTKHAGFVVNAGGATAADVLALIEEVQERVFATSGVRLEPEVRLWN